MCRLKHAIQSCMPMTQKTNSTFTIPLTFPPAKGGVDSQATQCWSPTAPWLEKTSAQSLPVVKIQQVLLQSWQGNLLLVIPRAGDDDQCFCTGNKCYLNTQVLTVTKLSLWEFRMKSGRGVGYWISGVGAAQSPPKPVRANTCVKAQCCSGNGCYGNEVPVAALTAL